MKIIDMDQDISIMKSFISRTKVLLIIKIMLYILLISASIYVSNYIVSKEEIKYIIGATDFEIYVYLYIYNGLLVIILLLDLLETYRMYALIDNEIKLYDKNEDNENNKKQHYLNIIFYSIIYSVKELYKRKKHVK